MSFRVLALAVCAVVSLSAGAFAADPADKCPPRPGFTLFTPEQRLMMFADLKAQSDTGAVDVQILRQMQRDKLKAMTPEQRKAYADGLTKRWAALPPAQQRTLKAEAEAWRAAHPRPEGGPAHRAGNPDCPHPEH